MKELRLLEHPRTTLWAFVLLVLFHLSSAYSLLPPSEWLKNEPLLFSDHPIHTYRVYLYRAQVYRGGLPWGYDPMVSAGSVTQPAQDVGAKPQQVLSLLVPFLSPSAVVRCFGGLTAVIFPLGTLLACRKLRIDIQKQIWILLSLTAGVWLYKWVSFYFLYGLVSFAAASFLLPWVLVCWDEFLVKPGTKNFWLTAFASSALLLLHVLAPVMLLPGLACLVWLHRPLSVRRYLILATVLALVLLLNSFWLVPLVLGMKMPPPLRQPFTGHFI